MDEHDSMNFAVAKHIMQWQTEAYMHLWRDADGAIYSTSKKVNPRQPHTRFLPCTDLNAAHQMEEAIKGRDLYDAYVFALLGIVEPEYDHVDSPSTRGLWQLITATSEQRVRAALAIMEEG